MSPNCISGPRIVFESFDKKDRMCNLISGPGESHDIADRRQGLVGWRDFLFLGGMIYR